MNHLIIYVHPSQNSFSNAIMNEVKEFSIEKNHKTEVRDLYSIDFNPVLKSCDFMGSEEDKISKDIKREQKYLNWANLITFIYPVWWTGMPAILKGYIDRVFFYDLFFNYKKYQSEKLLQGKKVIIFNSMGTSNEIYEKEGMLKAMKSTSDIGIFDFCGIEVIQHKFFGAVKAASGEKRKEYLEEVRKILSKVL